MKIEGECHNKTTIPECSEDITALRIRVCECTQCVSTLHTHAFEGLWSKVTKPQTVNTPPILEKTLSFYLFFFWQTSSIGQQLSLQNPTVPTLGSLSDPATECVTQNANCAYVPFLPKPKPAEITCTNFPEMNTRHHPTVHYITGHVKQTW